MTPERAQFQLEPWAVPLRAALLPKLTAPFSTGFPPGFVDACVYPLQTGGKRVRPLLALAGARACGTVEPGPAVWAAAVAVELVHTYSLVHDDLPAMDDDDMRRGRPAVHKAFGEATAILVGDALLTGAFEVLSSVSPPATGLAMVAQLAVASGHQGMVGGQALDIGVDGPVRDEQGLMQVHRAKTGALIRASVVMGGMAASASPDQVAALRTYGEAVGLAFQLADDVLDKDEDVADDGPPSYVRLLGVDETLRRACAERDRALDAVAGLPRPDALHAIARFIVDRDH